jgi:succinylglutamate desuccinylase
MPDENPELERWLAHFSRIASPSPHGYAWSHHRAATGTAPRTHVVVSAMVHGDEYGTLPGIVRVIEDLNADRVAWSGPVTLFLGNPEAARAERRFLDFDLNRAWDFTVEREGHEPRRARALRPILDEAGLFLDLHQTILDSETPFWIFPWDDRFGQWARVLGTAPVGITRPPGQAFAAAGLRCVDEYVRLDGRPGFCVELGRKGFDPEQADNTHRTVVRLLETLERIESGETTLSEAADHAEPIAWFTTVHREAWGDPDRRLRPGLKNWSRVRKGADVSAPGSPPIRPTADGVVLFPKYLDECTREGPRPSHLYHLAVRLARTPTSEGPWSLDASHAPSPAVPSESDFREEGMAALDDVLKGIEAAIQTANEDEDRTHRVAGVIRDAAAKQGDAIDDAEVGRGVDFVKRYVGSVPRMLREALQRAEGTIAEDKMERMARAAAAYWDADADVIPDDQGLLGILDDAYCSLSLISALSKRLERDTGTALVSIDLAGPTNAVRNLLGEPIADKLDDYVEEALADASVDDLMNSLREAPPDPPPAHSTWDGDDDELILRLFGVMDA